MDTFSKIAESVVLEHQIAELMSQQKTTGWPFDVRRAQELENTLLTRLEKLRSQAESICTYVPGNLFTPRRDNQKQGYVAGAEMQRLKDFNPSSREHIAWWFKTFQGWTPTKLTPTGKPVIDETVLKEIGTEEALVFLEILVIQKKLGMLSQPNWKLVDSDLSGIELRLFAHYLHRYDGGRYAKILLEQDIHQVNADKIGISRRQVKTITYCFLYGGGNQKLGLSYDNMLSPEAAKKKGAEIRRAYLDAVEGLEDLVNATRRVAEGGSIRAIDKRQIIVDKEHKALNCLLQGSAAVIAKRWLLLTHQNLGHLTHERYAFVHDEQVLGAPAENAEEVANVCKLSALLAGEYYNIRLPIEADAQVGDNWAEVH
jgi:hypothetical protein